MRIGIDISQTTYENTGVGNYLSNLVSKLLTIDKKNEYVLFFSSLRGSPSLRVLDSARNNPRAIVKSFKIPPTVLSLLWNKLHVLPVESLIGDIDLFISSDWAEPPTKHAKKATIIYDLIVYKYPEETHSKTEFKLNKLNISANIVDVQKKKLSWVKRESDILFCISKSTKNDAVDLLDLDPKKVKVIYPGLT